MLEKQKGGLIFAFDLQCKIQKFLTIEIYCNASQKSNPKKKNIKKLKITYFVVYHFISIRDVGEDFFSKIILSK